MKHSSTTNFGFSIVWIITIFFTLYASIFIICDPKYESILQYSNPETCNKLILPSWNYAKNYWHDVCEAIIINTMPTTVKKVKTAATLINRATKKLKSRAKKALISSRIDNFGDLEWEGVGAKPAENLPFPAVVETAKNPVLNVPAEPVTSDAIIKEVMSESTTKTSASALQEATLESVAVSVDTAPSSTDLGLKSSEVPIQSEIKTTATLQEVTLGSIAIAVDTASTSNDLFSKSSKETTQPDIKTNATLDNTSNETSTVPIESSTELNSIDTVQIQAATVSIMQTQQIESKSADLTSKSADLTKDVSSLDAAGTLAPSNEAEIVTTVAQTTTDSLEHAENTNQTSSVQISSTSAGTTILAAVSSDPPIGKVETVKESVFVDTSTTTPKISIQVAKETIVKSTLSTSTPSNEVTKESISSSESRTPKTTTTSPVPIETKAKSKSESIKNTVSKSETKVASKITTTKNVTTKQSTTTS